MLGDCQPCGSPRKNWAMSASRAAASASGLAWPTWAPILLVAMVPRLPTSYDRDDVTPPGYQRPPFATLTASPTNDSTQPGTTTQRWAVEVEVIWATAPSTMPVSPVHDPGTCQDCTNAHSADAAPNPRVSAASMFSRVIADLMSGQPAQNRSHRQAGERVGACGRRTRRPRGAGILGPRPGPVREVRTPGPCDAQALLPRRDRGREAHRR